uniref:Arrestin C-terminal-like domain-containing protein n=1 Tax=Panagrolaimus superbus TaxID=310955 RepID=A0A914Z7E8_9BILA
MQVFSILLDSDSNAYFGNTIVNSCVILRSNKEIKVRSIAVSIRGKAEASWVQNRGKRHDKYQTFLLYIKEDFTLWKCPDTSNKLPPGEYQFPFQFFIPHDAPPNIYSDYGNIRYWIDANLDIPWGFDKSVKLEFSVCPFVDLNAESRFAIPVMKHVQTTSNPLKNVTIKIPKMGYVYGESIPLYVEIGSNLISSITYVEMGIQRIWEFTAECLEPYIFTPTEPMTKIASKKYPLHRISSFPIEKNYSVTLFHSLCLPPLPPSYDYCGFIKVYYSVFVKLHTKAKFSSGPTVCLPIVIGTIPLKEMLTEVGPCVIGDDDYIHPPIPTSITSEFNFENVQFWEEKSLTDSEADDIYVWQPKSVFS